MDRWTLLVALVLAAIAAVQGAQYVWRGKRSRWTVLWMLCCWVALMAVLGMRGEMRGSCPLGDTGEVLVFAAWSLLICYFVVGPAFHLSLLGVFTAPLIVFFIGMALLPGMLESNPAHADDVDGWREAHAAFSVLAYGALGLAAVASVMFLMLNKLLKGGELTPGLFRHLPPICDLSAVVRRLLWLGFGVLTLGVVSGVVMESSGNAVSHLIAAAGQWIAYLLLLIWMSWRGMPPKRLAVVSVVLFVLSLLIFALL